MLIKLFKSRQQFVIILILVLTLSFWLPSLISYNSLLFVFDFFPALFYRPFQVIEYSYPIASTVFSLILLIIIGFMLVRLNVRFFFIQTRTQLPAFFYILICSSFIPGHRMNPALIGCFFIVLALYKIFDSYKKEKLCYNFFDASLLVSVASMFYFNYIFFIVAIWAGLIILRPFIWREWVFTIVGIILPYMLILSYYYLRDYDINKLLDTYSSYFAFKRYEIKFDLSYRLLLLYYLLMLLIGSVYMVSVFTTKKIYSRKYFLFILWLFIISIAVYIFMPSAGYEMIFMLAISASFLFTHYYVNIKSGWMNDLLFNLFPGLLIYLRAVNM